MGGNTIHKANFKGWGGKKGVLDMDLDNPYDMAFNLVGLFLLLLLFRFFYFHFLT